MKSTKTCHLGPLTLTASQETGMTTSLTVNKREVTLEDVRELVKWLTMEVLHESPVTLSIPTGESKPNQAITIQQFPALEDRTIRHDIKDIVSAIKPGEVDPFAGRRAVVDKSKITRMAPTPDLSGVEVRGGDVAQPFRVKLNP